MTALHEDRELDDRAPDDRGDDGYSEPARADAAPAAPDRFEFPELGGPVARSGCRMATPRYPDETYPTVPEQHYPAEPEPAYQDDDHYPHTGNARLEASRQDAAYPQGGGGTRASMPMPRAIGTSEYDYADGEEGAYEDDEPGGKRRNTIKIGLAVLGVVVLGSAGGVRLSHGVPRWHRMGRRR